MWHLGTWPSGGLGSAGLMVALDDIKGLFPHKWFREIVSMVPYGLEYPSGQLGPAVPAVSPPNFSSPPSLCIVTAGETEQSLTGTNPAQKQLKTSLWYQHHSYPKSKTQHCTRSTRNKMDPIPAETRTTGIPAHPETVSSLHCVCQ